ncbi:MAG: bifunctional UDP-N-acetylglucosamine diphosphorylase/glucosamine-1-phosphate N-acetyltransferase GlmU [Gammaproteobacteria bacterium WSBS_2016_MAG_OTU1]
MKKIIDVVVLAAGRGSRLRSDIPKPLMPLAGEPLLAHLLATVSKLSPRRVVVVVSPQADDVRAVATAAYPQVEFAIQQKQQGTADAARCGVDKLAKGGTTLILCADTPLLQATQMQAMRRKANTGELALMCFHAENPHGYGRIVRESRKICAIVEHKEASAAERKISEVFAGALAAPTTWLQRMLKVIAPIDGHKGKQRAKLSAGGEYYLTTLPHFANQQNMVISAVSVSEDDAIGINTMGELAIAEAKLRQRRAQALMARGVYIADPARLDIRGQVRVARGVHIDVNVILNGQVTLSRGCHIGAHCILSNCTIGANVEILPFCHIDGATIGDGCTIGPFARLRPQTTLGAAVHVGNFVEVKKSTLAAGVKAGHLAYLGDAEVGEGVNIGAGVITCNYDGRRKHRTIIGENSFIGSDTQLVAPVRVGKNSYVAAGTTLTKDTPAGHLTTSRIAQSSRALRKRS